MAASHELAQILVDHSRVDGLPLSVPVDVLKEELSRKLLAALDEARQSTIVQNDLVSLAALAREAEEGRAIARKLDVPVAQGRQPVRAVAARVLLVSDPQQGRIKQRHHRGEHFLPRQSRSRKVLLETPAKLRQIGAEFDHPRELAVVAGSSPIRVVTVLFA